MMYGQVERDGAGPRLGGAGWRSVLVLLVLLAGCRAGSDRPAEPPVVRPTLGQRVVPPAAARHLIQAQEASRQGAYRAALALTDSAAVLAPDLPEVYLLRGNLYTTLNRFDEAKAAYTRLLALTPDYRGARLNLGNLAFRQGQFHDAVALYREEQARHPAPTTLDYMGRAYAKLGQADSARHAFEAALALDASYAPAYLELGRLYESTGQPERALEAARQALSLDPGNLNYRYFAGVQLLRNGRFEEAAGYLQAVVAQRPWHHGAHSNLGQALARMGRREEAQRLLARADTLQQLQAEVERAQVRVEVDPNAPAHWVALAQILHRAQRYEEAAQAYRAARLLDPSLPAPSTQKR